MGAPGAPYMAKTDKERLATGFWNRIESNQAADCNKTETGVHTPTIRRILKSARERANYKPQVQESIKLNARDTR